ncbi:hypothetical protein [Sphingobacterium wenxiniae]|uniref:Uncharacterized protein n=1 Tax=Sphingobacterium wenxiniae TaxID=683125 RepID=A0A1I6PHH8_9SPHI|nr:hypothetical protein [Sphingobacterium wenxiniae]SFS39630.1 hypothetical protein SAMN05660206_101471 [Sphingobacterium wenxiniae]
MRKTLFIYTLLCSVLVAYLLNTNTRFFEFQYYLSQPTFFWFFAFTLLLLWLYMWGISWLKKVTVNWFMVYARRPPWVQHILFYILACLTVGLFHLFLLSFLYTLIGSDLRSSGYLKRGFPTFVLVLLLYVGLLAWKPSYSIFYYMYRHALRKKAKQLIQWKEKQLNLLADMHTEPSTVMEVKAESTILEPVAWINTVQTLDILVFVSKRKGSVLYMTNGEVILTLFSAKVIMDWKSKHWFLKIANGRYVNMYHLRRSKSSKYRLQASSAICKGFYEKSTLDEKGLQKLLHVSEWFEQELAHHEIIRDSLPRDCWNEWFEYA